MFQQLLKILGGIFGFILVVSVGIGIYVWYSGNQNSRESQKFARESMEAIAKDWNVTEVLNRYNPRRRMKIDHETLRKTLDVVKNAGGLRALTNVEGVLLLMKSLKGDPDSIAVYRGDLALEKHQYVMRLYLSKWNGRWFIDQIDLCDKSVASSLEHCRL